MKISDTAQAISISSKTVAIRLEKLTENRIAQFTIFCNPAAIIWNNNIWERFGIDLGNSLNIIIDGND